MIELFQQFSEHLRPIIKEVIEEVFTSHYQGRQSQKNETRFLTRKETAERLKISLVALHHHVINGKLKTHRVGSRVLFKEEEVTDSLIKIIRHEKEKYKSQILENLKKYPEALRLFESELNQSKFN
jgi:excisionase family DNA binding protein